MSRIGSDGPHHARLLDLLAQRCEVLLSAIFIACSQRKPFCSETSKAEPRSMVTIVLSGLVAIAFSGYPRGLGSDVRLGVRDTQGLTNQLRLSLEPECFENPRPSPEKIPGWSGSAQRHSSCLWFQMLGVEAHSCLPHDQHDGGNFPGKVRRAISGRMPLSAMLCKLLERTGFARSHDRRALNRFFRS